MSAIAFLFSCLETAFNSFPLVSSPGEAGSAPRRADGRAAPHAPLVLTRRFFQDHQSLRLLPSGLLPDTGFSFPSVSISLLREDTLAALQLEAHEHLKLRDSGTDSPL